MIPVLCVVCDMLYTRINNDHYIFNNMDHAIEAMYERFVKNHNPAFRQCQHHADYVIMMNYKELQHFVMA